MSTTSAFEVIGDMGEAKGDDSGHGGYSALVGYGFSINYILGVGVLSMPYAFYEAGIALSIVAVLVVTGVSVMTMLWLTEVAGRAEGMAKSQELLSEPSGGSSVGGDHRFEIRHRKFEINELVDMFIHPKGSSVYTVIISLYMYGALWSYSAVFASSVVSHIPTWIHGGTCDIYDDHGSDCHEAYVVFVVIYGIIVVPLSCLDLTEQIPLQVALTVMRFVAIIAITVTAIVGMYTVDYSSGDRSHDVLPHTGDYWGGAHWSGLGTVLNIFVYSQIVHHSCPGLSQPVRDKSKLRRMFVAMFVTTACMYVVIGVPCTMYFGSDIEKVATLNWKHYADKWAPAVGTPARNWGHFLSYFLILFPAVDVVSAFPLNAITLANNLMQNSRWAGTDRRVVRSAFRLAAAIPPVIGSAIVYDLSVIIQWTGFLGYVIAFGVPTLLALYSERVCLAKLGHAKTPYSNVFSRRWCYYAVLAFTVACFLFAFTSQIQSEAS